MSRHRIRPTSLPNRILPSASSPNTFSALAQDEDESAEPGPVDEGASEATTETLHSDGDDDGQDSRSDGTTIKRRFLSASSADVSIRRIRRGRSATTAPTTTSSAKPSPAKSRLSSTSTNSILHYPVGRGHKRHVYPNHHQPHYQPRHPLFPPRNDYSTGLFVANLPPAHEDAVLVSAMYYHFGRYGRVANVKVRRELNVPQSGRGEVWGWVWLQDEATALRALEAAPTDEPLLDRKIRVERARAHRSLTVRALPPATLIQEPQVEERWVIKTPAAGDQSSEAKVVDVGALFGEYGEVEAISLRAGDVDGAREPSVDVRFAHRDDSISALNSVRRRHPEFDVSWTHSNLNPAGSHTPPPGDGQPTSAPRPQPSTSNSAPLPIRHSFRGGRGGYRGSFFSFARARGGRPFGGRGGHSGRSSFQAGEGRAAETEVSRTQGGIQGKVREEETLRPDEWPALPGIKTPTKLRWDRPDREPGLAAIGPTASSQQSSPLPDLLTPTAAIIVPATTLAPSPSIQPAVVKVISPQPTSTEAESSMVFTGLASARPLAVDASATVSTSVPPVPARALSSSLHKSNSLPLPLPEDELIGPDDTRPTSSEIEARPCRPSTPPPPTVHPTSHETPKAPPNINGTPQNETTPGLSQGSASPSSPVVGTPLGIGAGVSLGSRGDRRPSLDTEGEVLVNPNAIFVGGLNKVAVDDFGLRAMFEVYGTITDFQYVTHAPKTVHGFAFITFADRASASAAVDSEHGRSLFGSKIRVQLREVQVQHKPRSSVHSSPNSRLIETSPTRSGPMVHPLYGRGSLPTRTTHSRPMPLPMLVPIQQAIFSGLPFLHHPYPPGGSGSRLGLPPHDPYTAYGPAFPTGGEPMFANVHPPPPQMMRPPDGLPYSPVYYPPPMYGYPYSPSNNVHQPPGPNPFSGQEHAAQVAQVALPTSDFSTLSLHSAPQSSPLNASSSFVSAHEMQPLSHNYHRPGPAPDHPYPVHPQQRQGSEMMGSPAIVERVREIQEGHARLSGHHAPPHMHGGGYTPPSSSSAYTSAFTPYSQSTFGRPEHHHLLSGGSAGSDAMSNPHLTPVGSGFGRSSSYPPHPTPSAASSHYPHPDSETQPPSPFPFDHRPANPFAYPVPTAMNPYSSGAAFQGRDAPPHMGGGEGQGGGLEPSPFISSPLDPAVGSFCPGERVDRDVGHIGEPLVGGAVWADATRAIGSEQQQQ